MDKRVLLALLTVVAFPLAEIDSEQAPFQFSFLGLTESVDEDGAEDSKHRNIKLQVGIKKAIGG